MFALRLQLISSAAVLVTLVYLAIETRQNTAATRSNARQTQSTMDQTSLWNILNHADLFENITNGEPLTATDQSRVTFMWLASIRIREHEWRQYEEGALDEATWLAYRKPLSYLLGTERTRRWWRVVGRNVFHPDFAKMVDSLIESEPVNNLLARTCDWDNDETTEAA